ncbi:MAG: RNA methyltransferase [Actinomycetota bacterium]|nr:RNA methyltransferase [Actinomycetota bacterium]
MSAARKLHRRKVRANENAFLIEGPIQLEDAIAAGADVLEVFVEDSREGDVSEQLCRRHGLAFWRVDRSVERTLTQTVTSQGVVAVVRSPAVSIQDIPESADLVLVLAEVRDPGNAGTLIRSAAAAGAGAVVFSSRAVDPLGAKAVRSAAGALFRVPLVLGEPLDHAISVLGARGFVVLGGDPHAMLAPEDCDMTGRSAVIVGNEAWGIPGKMEHVVDRLIGIPMPGSTESLNVAVAGSILLFEAVRQRRSAAAGQRP